MAGLAARITEALADDSFGPSALAVACADEQADRARSPDDSIGAKLSRSLQFPAAMLLNGPLPATTDPRAVLLPCRRGHERLP